MKQWLSTFAQAHRNSQPTSPPPRRMQQNSGEGVGVGVGGVLSYWPFRTVLGRAGIRSRHGWTPTGGSHPSGRPLIRALELFLLLTIATSLFTLLSFWLRQQWWCVGRRRKRWHYLFAYWSVKQASGSNNEKEDGEQ